MNIKEQFLNDERYSALRDCSNLKETLWINPDLKAYSEAEKTLDCNPSQIDEAEQRLIRFAPLIKKIFPETESLNGIIESPIKEIKNMKEKLEEHYNTKVPGKLLLKMDSHLPIAGSIKARGGIYEILKFAEELAISNNFIALEDDYSKLDSKECRELFNKYTIQVGSTGNLGLSIGTISAKLGFKVIVHMSVDAKQWKKDLLRSRGATVVEYECDYCHAVEEGRRIAMNTPMNYFVDDENSLTLFMGYSVAARHLQRQLEKMNVAVDSEHPLFVYLPCGIGGAPGGITYGLKTIYKDNVHCFFVEATHAPCMIVGMATKLHDEVCIQDFGVDGITHADGLAVSRPSKLVGKLMESILSGIFTIEDAKLYDNLRFLHETEGINIEPSSCASFAGPSMLLNCSEGISYIKQNNLEDKMKNAAHISWATGGSLVPKDMLEEYLKTYLK